MNDVTGDQLGVSRCVKGSSREHLRPGPTLRPAWWASPKPSILGTYAVPELAAPRRWSRRDHEQDCHARTHRTMLRLAATGLRVSQRGAALQMSRRCLVTKFSKVRSCL